MEDFQAIMRPGCKDDLLLLEGFPRYRIALQFVNTEEAMLVGREELLFVNQEDVALDDLVLRLYPNYWPLVGGYDPHMQVGDVQVDGELVETEYIASNTGVLIPLPKLLSPDETTRIELSFTMSLGPGNQGYWTAAYSYPLLAVNDESGWRIDLATNGDLVYSESGIYIVELTLPKRMAVAASGTETNRKYNSDGTISYTFIAAGMRDFALVFGEALQKAQNALNGTMIYLWHLTSDPLVSAKLELVSDAMRFFDSEFGLYPYVDLDVMTRFDPEYPFPSAAGVEYPGLITISHGEENWQWTLAHEVAHQWWFSVIGNDILLEPWLDEAMAEYSTYLFFQEVYEEDEANEVFYENVLKEYNEFGLKFGRISGEEPVGLSVYDFPSFDAMYFWIVYGKGALFLDELREEMGRDAFTHFS
jgi:hypothetical protein